MAPVRRRATRAVHLKFGGALRAQGVGGRPRAGALRAHLLCHRGGAALRDVFSLEEVPPSLISPLVTGTEPVDPSTRHLRDFLSTFDAGAGVHTTRTRPPARAPRGWPPGAGRIVARPRNCGSWWAAARLQRPATRLDVSRRRQTTTWPRRGAATRHRYGIPVQSFFMKPRGQVL